MSTTDPRLGQARGRSSRVTIGDIARTLGISKAAVSYALNGQPGVGSETRAEGAGHC